MYLNARFYDPSTGRFITQDTYRGERDDASTWHLYVYCANNPVNFVDPSGHIAISAPLAFGGAVIALTSLSIYTTTDAFKQAWNQMTSAISTTLNEASEYAKRQAESLVDKIAVSYAKAKKKYKNKTEQHHIVAQKAARAKVARWVFNKVGKKTSDSDNIIPLKKGLHKRLHRPAYFNMVNSIMRSAYYKKSSKGSINKNKANVEHALEKISTFLSYINDISPF